MSKKKRNEGGIVYSTDPHFFEEETGEAIITRSPAEQKLTVSLDTKHRAGKSVTAIQGFVGAEADLEQLGKHLRNFCGTGGTVKEGIIIIQGDQREKVMQWLLKNGYTQTQKR